LTSCTLAGEGFGSSHDIWETKNLESVKVARADGLPLLAEHLEALCSYTSSQIEPRLSGALEGLGPCSTIIEREALLSSITAADFEEFFRY
jgi:hypothetical protein